MKYFFSLILFLVTLPGLRAGEIAGMLTLEGGRVYFRAPGVVESYTPENVPGLKLIKYERLSQVQNDKEIDISELTFAPPRGARITLRANLSVPVTKNDAETGTVWTVRP